MAGSVHNVNDYAPPGYKLAATHYADGKCTHVFEAVTAGSIPLPDDRLVCVVGQHDDEAKALALFKAMHSAPAVPVQAVAASAYYMDATRADTLPAPAPKPAKRKGGNGG